MARRWLGWRTRTNRRNQARKASPLSSIRASASHTYIINQYIDERFPHLQLMPADPLMRARLMLFNFGKELFVHVNTLENERNKIGDKSHDKARRNPRPPDQKFSSQVIHAYDISIFSDLSL